MQRKSKPGIQKEYRGLTQRTRSLLRVSEGMNVDFKREVSGIKSRDLVAFANTPLGGTILVGIDEYTDAEGVQRGRVVGCDVDDNARLVIVNKATDCFPTVELAIFVENVAKKPILRIEIPPGHYKPYCTQRGEYCIRSDARVRALFPDELLGNLYGPGRGAVYLPLPRRGASAGATGWLYTSQPECRYAGSQWSHT